MRRWFMPLLRSGRRATGQAATVPGLGIPALRTLALLILTLVVLAPAAADSRPVSSIPSRADSSRSIPSGSIPTASIPWGADGHRMAARASVDRLPDAIPAFFRDARGQLAWLNPEPDRWRIREMREMDVAWSYDHHIDLENVPEPAREASHRYAFLQALDHLERPERDAGLLPYRILELQQRLTSMWIRWHRSTDPRERRWIEDRIVSDAGILGHYVTDGSQPHHTTIHFNGWNASGARTAPNPEGFTTSRDFHRRFEAAFVSAHVEEPSVRGRVPRAPRDLGDTNQVRRAVWDYLADTHGHVWTLYRLEQRHGFDPQAEPASETVEFAEERLAAGAAMLRDLWWTAYRRGSEAG